MQLKPTAPSVSVDTFNNFKPYLILLHHFKLNDNIHVQTLATSCMLVVKQDTDQVCRAEIFETPA